MRRAFAEQLIDPMSIRPDELDAVAASPQGLRLDRTRDRRPPITDVADAISWWASFHTSRAHFAHSDDDLRHGHERLDPYRASPKVGRNEPCPCGSGRKYKRCCGA